MYLAAANGEAAGTFAQAFQLWDLFMFGFTILIAWGFIRLLRNDRTNKLGIGFSAVALLLFLFLDVLVVANWMGYLDEIQDAMSFLRSW
jgi:hypothetical protein